MTTQKIASDAYEVWVESLPLWWTCREAAKFLGVHRLTITARIKDGTLATNGKACTRDKRIRRDSILALKGAPRKVSKLEQALDAVLSRPKQTPEEKEAADAAAEQQAQFDYYFKQCAVKWCPECDAGFGTEAGYDAHMAEHEAQKKKRKRWHIVRYV